MESRGSVVEKCLLSVALATASSPVSRPRDAVSGGDYEREKVPNTSRSIVPENGLPRSTLSGIPPQCDSG